MTLLVQRALFPEARVSSETATSAKPLESDDGDDDDDTLTLARIFRSSPPPPPPPVHHDQLDLPEKHQDSRVPKKKRGRDFSSGESGSSNKRCRKTFPEKDFKKLDLVWAKAFAYSWWPGFIQRIKNSSALVSFYGCEKTRWFRLREIRGFEEYYPRISKLVCVKLAGEISLALEELSRRTVIGLSCGASAAEGSGMSSDQISEVKEGFDPIDVLGFVGDLAVSAWVGEEEAARVVRMSSQVYAFRRYVKVVQYSEVDGGFDSATLLEFIHGVAVSSHIDDVDASSFEETTVRLNGVRQFVSVCPGWMYQGTTGLEDDLLSEESEGELQMPDSSDRGEVICEVIRILEEDISFNNLGMDWETNEQQVPEGREICLLNRADFDLLDIDEEYDSLMDNQLEIATKLENFYLSEDLEIQRSCTSNSIEQEDVDIIHNENLFEQSADDGTYKNVQLGCYLPYCDANSSKENLAHQLDLTHSASGHILAYKDRSASSVETEYLKQEGVVTMHIEHENGDSASTPVTLIDSYLVQTAPIAERQLTTSSPRSNMQCAEKTVECIEPQSSSQSSPNVSLVLQNETAPRGIISTISSLTSTSKSPPLNILKKGICGSAFQNFFKLHKSLVPYAEAKSYAKLFMKYISFTGYENCTYEEVINGNNISGKNLLPENADNDAKSQSVDKYLTVSRTLLQRKLGRKDSMKGSYNLTLPKPTSKKNLHQKKRHDWPIVSGHPNWTGLYSSPLIRERSKSICRYQRSFLVDKSINSFKTLHMKFPKDFKMPSREELEKKFVVFGPLDCSRTRLFFYTGAAQVVFFHQTDADAAYKYVKIKNVFGHANVRFWFDKHENFRKGARCHNHESLCKEGSSLLERNPSSEGLDVLQKKNKNSAYSVSTPELSVPVHGHSPSDLKSCLQSPDALAMRDNKKICKVRFTIET
ncbi:uncharacterized protein [Typha latifolia]|uniref:uncharacterized protein isoform X2 n=1 Tax=Typha latifolia TaxID=4733 RepID=UPI003C2F7538